MEWRLTEEDLLSFRANTDLAAAPFGRFAQPPPVPDRLQPRGPGGDPGLRELPAIPEPIRPPAIPSRWLLGDGLRQNATQ